MDFRNKAEINHYFDNVNNLLLIAKTDKNIFGGFTCRRFNEKK